MDVSIQSIPNDLITKIALHVASSSSEDLCNLKQTCKAIRASAEEDSVYKHVCMDTIPVLPHNPTMQAAYFLRVCELSGNPEAIFRQGAVQYFLSAQLEFGRSLLSRAASNGHQEAAYLLGIIILCTGNESKEQALTLLNKVRSRRAECRNKCHEVLKGIWTHQKIHPGEFLCTDISCKRKTIRKISQSWDDEDVELDCVGCTWDYEAHLFCRTFGVFSTFREQSNDYFVMRSTV